MTSSSVLVVLIICSVEIGNVCKAVPVDLEADLKDTPEVRDYNRLTNTNAKDSPIDYCTKIN